jgi:four helix bundle protein
MDNIDSARLEHEILDVYHVALELHVAACAALPRRGARFLRDQLERATMSAVLNIAEGAGRRTMPDKRRFYEIARGSAMETAAILDLLRVRELAVPDVCQKARRLAVRVVQMLSRMCPIR